MPPKPPRLTPEAAGQIMREIANVFQAQERAKVEFSKKPQLLLGQHNTDPPNLNPGEENAFFTMLQSALESKDKSLGKSLDEPFLSTMSRYQQAQEHSRVGRLLSKLTQQKMLSDFDSGIYTLSPAADVDLPRPISERSIISHVRHDPAASEEFIGPEGQSFRNQPLRWSSGGPGYMANLRRDSSVRGSMGTEDWVFDPRREFANPIDNPARGKTNFGDSWVKLYGGDEPKPSKPPSQGDTLSALGALGATGTGFEALQPQPSEAASNLGRSATETELLSKILGNPIHKFASGMLGYDPSTSDEEAMRVVDSLRSAPASVWNSIKEAFSGAKQYGPAGAVLPGLQGLGAAAEPIFSTARRGQKLISEKVGGIPGAALATLPDAIMMLLGNKIGKGPPKGASGDVALPGRGLVEGASPLYPQAVAGGAPVGGEGIGNLLGSSNNVAKPPPPFQLDQVNIVDKILQLLGQGKSISGGAGGQGIVPGMPLETPSHLMNAHAREGIPSMEQYRNVNPEDFKYYPFEEGKVSTWPYPGISTLRSGQKVGHIGLQPGSYDIPGIPVEEGGDPFLKDLGVAFGNMSGAVYNRLRPLFEKLYQGPVGLPK